MKSYRDAFLHIRSLPPAFWIVISATFINQTGNMAFVFLILYLTQLGFGIVKAAFAFSVFSGSMLISGFLGGSYIDRIGAARLMSLSLFANAFTLMSFPLLHNYHAIIIICVLWGIFFGIFRPASSTFVSYLSSPGMHKITFSVYRLSLNLGMSIGPAVGGYLAMHSFSSVFIANGAANLIASIILLLGLLPTQWFYYRPGNQITKIMSLKILKHDSILRLFIFGMIPVSMIFFQHESTLAVFIHKDLSLPLNFYGLLFTLNTLLIVIFELLLNIAMIKWQYKNTFLLGSSLIIVGFTCLYFANSAAFIIATTVIWTFGEMILYPAASSYITDIAPEEHRGSYMGVYSLCSNLGLLLGPLAGSLVLEEWGCRQLWIACGFLGMVTLIIFSFLHEPSKEKIAKLRELISL